LDEVQGFSNENEQLEETNIERESPQPPSAKEIRKKIREGSEETDKSLTTLTIIFFIGLLGIIVQFLAFVAILFLEIEAIPSFSWIPLMSLSLAGGIIGVGCLLAAFIIAMIYKKRCKKNGVEPNRGRWYSIWITSIILAMVFLGNLIFTAFVFLLEFF
jgi:hypothetical protein